MQKYYKVGLREIVEGARRLSLENFVVNVVLNQSRWISP